MKRLILLHGNDEVGIADRRLALISELLEPSVRSQNYSEYYPSGNRYTVGLSKIMAEVVSDLSTSPFAPAENRVVVIYNLDELFSRRKGKKKKDEGAKKASGRNVEGNFVALLEKELGSMRSVLILVAVEDYERNRKINKGSEIYKVAERAGVVERYEEKPILWDFNDAFMERDTERCIGLLRDWLRASKQAQPIFFNLVRQVELLTQSRLQGRLEREPIGEKLEYYFPRGMKPNITQESPGRQRLLARRARNFTFTELINAMEQLLKLNFWVFPTREDAYVPDIQVILERYIIETLERSAAKAKR